MSVPTRGVQLLRQLFPYATSPFITNAPMLGHADGALAAAVAKAGGLGHIAGVLDTSKPGALDPLTKELTKARQLLSLSESDSLPIGVGFLTFHATSPNLAKAIEQLVRTYKPACIWLFAPSDPSPHSSLIPSLKGLTPSVPIIVQVGSVSAAREAVRHGADIVVAQGIDAGGHQWARGAGIVSLVPEIVDMLDAEFPERNVAVLAAGGIVDGRGVAAALALGAHGVVMGTRFVVSKECPVKDNIKQVYLQTTDGGATTVKSPLHDDVRGTGFWPAEYDGRAIIGGSWNDLQAGTSMADVQEKYKEAAAAGDVLPRAIIWSGTGVGIIREIKSAEDIVREVQQDARKVWSSLANM